MKQFKLILSALLLTLAASAFAEIREAKTMDEALYGAGPQDLIVFDIDNTILMPVQTLGSDQWVEYLIERNKHRGMDDKAALEAALSDWEKVQRVTNVRLVEENTASYIKWMREAGYNVIILTARPEELRKTTRDQLESLDVYFDSDEDMIFANGKNKGVVLKEYMAKHGIHPKSLIFIDDKVKNVKNMDDAFAGASFQNINYRYGAADGAVKAFSPEVAELEWQRFQIDGTLISDELAEEILNPAPLAMF